MSEVEEVLTPEKVRNESIAMWLSLGRAFTAWCETCPDWLSDEKGGDLLMNFAAKADQCFENVAQAIEARSAKTEGLGPQDESAVRQDAPEQPSSPLKGNPHD